MDYDNYTLDELFRIAFHEENRLALAILDRMEDETIRLRMEVEPLERESENRYYDAKQEVIEEAIQALREL